MSTTDALRKLVYEAVRFAIWAGGEGISPAKGEPAGDPDEFVYEYTAITDDEDWDTLPERAAALCATPPDPNGWQPIETAPKDGTKLLLGLNCISQGSGTKVQVGWWGELNPEYQDQNCLFEGCEGWLGDEWFPGADQPTHWQPLPAAPTEARDE